MRNVYTDRRGGTPFIDKLAAICAVILVGIVSADVVFYKWQSGPDQVEITNIVQTAAD